MRTTLDPASAGPQAMAMFDLQGHRGARGLKPENTLPAFEVAFDLGVASVESCMVEAVRRWEFPQPAGGGLVSVSYPFQLAPAGL